MQDFWDEIKTQLQFYKDRVFFLPLDDIFIEKVENKVDVKFPKIYFEFLKEFGFTQDFLTEIEQTEGCLTENLDYINEVCPAYFPIGICEESEKLWMLKKNSSDNNIYEISLDAEEGIIPKNKEITFKDLLFSSLNKIKQDYHSRALNESKTVCYEFQLKIDDFNSIINILNSKLATSWLDKNWKDKYNPPIFDIEVALIRIDNEQVIVEREDDIDGSGKIYSFDFEEPVMNLEKINKTQIIRGLFDSNKIEYELLDLGIIGIEE